jgi:hypothetical protein
MEYEQVKALAAGWLAGETTLAEEAALRAFFADANEELPADLQTLKPVFGQSAAARGERSHRKLVLHTEPAARQKGTAEFKGIATRRPLRRLIAAGTAAAAVAAVVVIALWVAPQRTPESDDFAMYVAPEHTSNGDIECVVNGVRITDQDEIAAYTREALKIANDNLRKPSRALSSELGNETALVRVGEMLNELSKNR